MKTAKNLGRKAAHLDKDEREEFKGSQETAILADIQRVKEQCSVKFRIKSDEEKIILGEISNLGNVPRSVVIESLLRGIWLCPLLIIAALGEYAFANWMIKYFGLGFVETHLVSATIVVVSLKAFDQYLTAIRERYRQAESMIFLVAGSMGVVAVFLLIFFGALIRKDLNMATAATNLTGTLEETIRQADQFYRNNAGNYVWLMVTLTIAFTVVGGVGYHEAKNRVFSSIGYLNLYRRLKHLRRKIELLGEEMVAQDARLERFRADFNVGLMEEKRRLAEKSARKNQKTKKQGQIQNLGPIGFGPLTLLLIALLIFLLLKGKAFGTEHMILLDISKSVEVKNYSGAETDFEKNVNAVETYILNRINPGDRFKIVGITEESFSRPYILLNAVFSKNKGAFGEGSAKEKLTRIKQWKKLDLKATAKATDIFGAVYLAAISFSTTESDKRLIIFSDMRQCAHEINLETPDKIETERVLKKVEVTGNIPQLKGVTVMCLGVHSAGKTPAYWMSLRDFWTQYFTMAQARLATFSVERRF